MSTKDFSCTAALQHVFASVSIGELGFDLDESDNDFL